MNRSTRCEVLVVGAGPTGLMAASLLRRRGVDVRIVDQRDLPRPGSRSTMVSPRSLELLASIGLVEPLLERGSAARAIDVSAYGTHVASLRLDRVFASDTPFRFMLLVPQAEIEAVLVRSLLEAGVSVDWGVKVTGLEQDAAGLVVQAEREGGAETFQARYAIAADGADSVIRKGLGVAFEALGRPHAVLAGDVRIDGLPDVADPRVFLDGERLGILVPLPGNAGYRVLVVDLRTPEAVVDGPPGGAPLLLEELQRAFADAVGDAEVVLRDPGWLARFTGRQRLAGRWRTGRVFLAGDAAHLQSPATGQGLDAGLMDAANLAWKLAAVLHGGIEEGLLDSYESERMPVANEAQRFGDQLLGLAEGQAGWRARACALLGARLPQGATLQGELLRHLGQFDVSYAARQVDGGEPVERSPRPGERAPQARLSGGVDVSDLLAGYRFAVLALSRRRLSAADLDRADGALAVLRETGAVTQLVARLEVDRRPEARPDEHAEAFDRYGLPQEGSQALVLLRPDGHVAWRAEAFDWMGCARALAAMCSTG